MALQEGNKFWARRSSHGRGMLFSSPQLMWEAACEYFAAEDDAEYLKKIEIANYQGGFFTKEIKCKVPYTWQGLCLYLGCSHAYFQTFKCNAKKYIADGIEVELYQEFLQVIEMIDQTIFKQQFDSAIVGVFKDGLVGRYLKLADKTEVTTPEDQTFKVTLKIE